MYRIGMQNSMDTAAKVDPFEYEGQRWPRCRNVELTMANAQINRTANKIHCSKIECAAPKTKAIREIARPKDGAARKTWKDHEEKEEPRRQDKRKSNEA